MQSRVLFVTTDYSYFTQPVTTALRQLGYRVKIFDYHKPTLLTRLTGLMRWHDYKLVLINQALVRAVNRYRPYYTLVIKGDTIFPATIRAINRLGTITINWFPDWLVSWRWIETHASAYTVFINSCFDTFQKLNRLGINNYYLPYAVTPHRYRSRKVYPVTFVGQHNPRRERYFKAIADLGLHLWGYDRWRTTPLSHLFHGPTNQTQTQSILRRSHIIVNILTGTDKFQPSTVNVRTFEALGVGSFLLVKHHPILRRHFNVGQELVTFTTPTDLRHKVKYYLTHASQREKIARAGYNRILKDHTFITRLPQLFKLVSQQSGKT